MKIISNLPSENIRKIQELVRKKSYNDIDEFVRISVENQLALESSSNQPSQMEVQSNSSTLINSNIINNLIVDGSSSIVVEMDEPKFEQIKYPNVPSEDKMWLWGQINKIFPIKFNVRYLYKLLKDGSEGINLEEFCKKASLLGRDLGIFLARFDDESGRKRDERFSTGLPIGEEKSKSTSKFCSQFIGYARSDETLSGALFVMKFANIRTEKSALKIGLTKYGLQFARLKNPIFDENNMNKNLSAEEIDFYLNHITKKVPGEAAAFGLILSLINSGIGERDDLNEKLKQFVPSTWSEELINTQRAGAMSRLYELGLIAKHKVGIYVKYEVSEKGKVFLTKSQKEKEYAYNA